MARDTQETRRRLLAAARAEFAEHGLEGARVDRIAEVAGVNKERIYGHFGSKEQLFEAVLSAALTEAAELKPAAGLTDPASYAAATFDFHRNNPDLIRLLMWESLQRQRISPEAAARRARFYSEDAQRLAAPGADDEAARFVLYSILALATWVQALPIASSMVFGGAPDPKDLRERIANAVAALVEPRDRSDGQPVAELPRVVISLAA